eukprot:m.103421 g.103421  ORF g.103421 m.103421 type:complete len:478 (+) comp13810_c0_seq2:353-1786(+)
MKVLGNWVGGKSVAPDGDSYIDDIAPALDEVIAKIPRSTHADVNKAVEAAKKAAPEWSALSLLDRAAWLDKIADYLEKNSDHVAHLESQDTGKPMKVARAVDAARSVHNFRFFADFGRKRIQKKFEMADATNTVIHKPIGVVGLITPWNLPLYLLSWKVAPALLMGNTIVAKPSELTPLTADYLAEAITNVGLPQGVINIVHGYGHECGQALVEHPDITAISFTGGTVTGRKVAATAAPMFKKLSLELGGKNATIVMEDADLEKTVPGVARAAFLNQGQVCLCGSRILVADKIYDKFKDLLVKHVNGMTVGSSENCDLGALISHEHRKKVEGYVALAKEEGGAVLTGGERPDLPDAKGAFLRPTLIEGLSIDSRTATEEIFGPVATLHRFHSEQEMIDMANKPKYGLCCSIWTQNEDHCSEHVAPKIDVGICWVNCWLHRDLRTPFGGVKHSGVGREGGDYSLDFFSETLNLCVKHK